MEVIQFSGKKEVWGETAASRYISTTWICWFILNVLQLQIWMLLFTRLWLTSSAALLLQVSPALPSEEGSLQRPSPLGHHENTVSKNRRSPPLLPTLPLFQVSVASICLSGWRTHSQIIHTLLHRTGLAPCWAMLLMVFVKYCREIA